MKISFKKVYTIWLGVSLLLHLVFIAVVMGILWKQFANLPRSFAEVAGVESGRIALVAFLAIGITAFVGALGTREGGNRSWSYAVLFYCSCVMVVAILDWTTGLVVSVCSPLELPWFVAGGFLSILCARKEAGLCRSAGA